jgi:hypothetical protein
LSNWKMKHVSNRMTVNAINIEHRIKTEALVRPKWIKNSMALINENNSLYWRNIMKIVLMILLFVGINAFTFASGQKDFIEDSIVNTAEMDSSGYKFATYLFDQRIQAAGVETTTHTLHLSHVKSAYYDYFLSVEDPKIRVEGVSKDLNTLFKPVFWCVIKIDENYYIQSTDENGEVLVDYENTTLDAITARLPWFSVLNSDTDLHEAVFQDSSNILETDLKYSYGEFFSQLSAETLQDQKLDEKLLKTYEDHIKHLNGEEDYPLNPYINNTGIYLPLLGEAREVTLYMGNNQSQRKIQLKTRANLIDNEIEKLGLFNQSFVDGSRSTNEMRLDLLIAYVRSLTGEDSVVATYLNDVLTTDLLTRYDIQNYTYQPVDLELLGEEKTAFLRNLREFLQSSLSSRSIEVDVDETQKRLQMISFSKEMFDYVKIDSFNNVNIYSAVYLLLLDKMDLPFDFMYNRNFREEGEIDSNTLIPLDKVEETTLSEFQTQLRKAAGQYLTWAAEYTPPTFSFQNFTQNSSFNLVWGGINHNWVPIEQLGKTTLDNGMDEDNYLKARIINSDNGSYTVNAFSDDIKVQAELVDAVTIKNNQDFFSLNFSDFRSVRSNMETERLILHSEDTNEVQIQNIEYYSSEPLDQNNWNSNFYTVDSSKIEEDVQNINNNTIPSLGINSPKFSDRDKSFFPESLFEFADKNTLVLRLTLDETINEIIKGIRLSVSQFNAGNQIVDGKTLTVQSLDFQIWKRHEDGSISQFTNSTSVNDTEIIEIATDLKYRTFYAKPGYAAEIAGTNIAKYNPSMNRTAITDHFFLLNNHSKLTDLFLVFPNIHKLSISEIELFTDNPLGYLDASVLTSKNEYPLGNTTNTDGQTAFEALGYNYSNELPMKDGQYTYDKPHFNNAKLDYYFRNQTFAQNQLNSTAFPFRNDVLVFDFLLKKSDSGNVNDTLHDWGFESAAINYIRFYGTGFENVEAKFVDSKDIFYTAPKNYFYAFNFGNSLTDFISNSFSPFVRQDPQEVRSGSDEYVYKYILGNPVPFVPGGVDSPRTFNYKIKQQLYARVFLARFLNQIEFPSLALAKLKFEEFGGSVDFTTLSGVFDKYSAEARSNGLGAFVNNIVSYNEGYIDFVELLEVYNALMNETDNSELTIPDDIQIDQNLLKNVDLKVLKSEILALRKEMILKPFLPGYYNHETNQQETNSLSKYSIDRSAGVDSFGLLTNILMQSSLSNLVISLDGKISEQQNTGYHAMNADPSTSISGVDSHGFPAFYSYEDNDEYYGISHNDMRLKAVDIATLSKPIIDFDTLIAGDILLDESKIYTPSEVHFGIILGFQDEDGSYKQHVPQHLMDIDDRADRVKQIMESTIVLVSRPGFTHVSIGFWKSQNHSFSGFAINGEDYLPRRLFFNGEREDVYSEDDLKILPKQQPLSNIDVRFGHIYEQTTPQQYRFIPKEVTNKDLIDTRNFSGENYRYQFIPNTGEYLVIEDIEFGLFDEEKYVSDGLNVELLSPRDYIPFGGGQYYFHPEEVRDDLQSLNQSYDVSHNIVYNRGHGFEFAAIYMDQATKELKGIPLANIIINELATDKELPYDITPIDSRYSTDLKTRDGKLEFHIAPGSTTTLFGIKPIESTGLPNDGVRFGDDIQLRFEVKNEESDMIALSHPRDRLAVYDKKMLWRANLYIDEEDRTGNGASDQKYPDWNKIHPWDAELTVNDWNITEYGSTVKSDGTQVVSIVPWTKNSFHLMTIKNNEHTVSQTGAVAYGWGTQGTPFTFNWKLEQQKKILDHLYNNNLHGYSGSSSWTSTYAPNVKANPTVQSSSNAIHGAWDNYIGIPNPEWTDGANHKSPSNAASTSFTIGQETLRPYRPGYSTRQRFGRSDTKNGYAWEDNYMTAGLDCSGFAQMAFSYLDNNYVVPDRRGDEYLWFNATNPTGEGRWDTNTSFKDPSKYDEILHVYETWNGAGNSATNTDFVTHYFHHEGKADFQDDFVLDFPVYPGDIFLIFNDKKDDITRTNHISIVDRVEYNEEGKTTIGGITFVESGSGLNREYKVLNYVRFRDYMRNYWNDFGLFKFVRYRFK